MPGRVFLAADQAGSRGRIEHFEHNALSRDHATARELISHRVVEENLT